MYTQVAAGGLGAVDLVEQAVVNVPVKYFVEKKGVQFESGCDDLDYYDGAYFVLNDGVAFALIHYKGSEPNSTAIYLDRRLSGNDLWRTIEHILEMFGIASSSITWMHKG